MVIGGKPNELAAYMVIPRPFIAATDQYKEVSRRYQVAEPLTILVIGRDKRIRYIGYDDVNGRLTKTGDDIVRTLNSLVETR